MKSLFTRLIFAACAVAPAVFAAEQAAPARRFAAPDLAAVFVIAFVARRLRGASTAGSNGIQVLAQASLGAKEKVVIVRVDGERLLLGVATGQVSLLKTLSPDAPTPPAVTSAQVQSFAALLKRSLGK